MADQRNAVITQLQGLGWSKEQAIGIAANLHQESSFRPDAVGDGGRAYGIAQWHPDRQADFQAAMGKPIQGSTLEEQVQFVDYELRKGKERAAGTRLQAATDAASAASVVSQYYERPADRAGEARRRGATAAGWAGQPWKDEEIPAVAPLAARPTSRTGGPFDLPLDPVREQLPSPKDVGRATAASGLAAMSAADIAGVSTAHADAVQEQRDAAVISAAQARANTGFGDAFQSARQDPRVQGLFTILDAVNRAPETVPPGWTYEANRDAIERDAQTEEELGYLRENVRGPQSLAQAQAQIAYRRELDRTYANAGGVAAFGGQMLGGLMDPVGFAMGLGTAKAFQLAGVGASALARAGRPALAVGSFVAENAVGNVAYEGLQDAFGEVKTTSDYAMAFGMGALMSAPFVRGVHASAVREATDELARGMQARAAREQLARLEETSARTEITDPVALARQVEKEELSQLKSAIDEASAPNAGLRERALPESVTNAIRREAEEGEYPLPEGAGKAPKTPQEPTSGEGKGVGTPEAENAPEPVPVDAPAKLPIPDDLADFDTLPKIEPELLDKRPVEALIPNRVEGNATRVTLDWRNDAPPAPGKHYTVQEVLDELESSDGNILIPPHLKPVVDWMNSTFSDAVRNLKIRFRPEVAARGDAGGLNGITPAGMWQPGNQTVTVNRSKLSQHAPVRQHLESLDPRHVETVLHEIVHGATHTKIEAYLRGLLPAGSDLHTAVKDFDGLLQDYRKATSVVLPEEWKAKYEAGIARNELEAFHKYVGSRPDRDTLWPQLYPGVNLHEFATGAMTSRPTQLRLAMMPGKPLAGKPTTAWQTFIRGVAKLLGFKDTAAEASGLTNATAMVDRIVRADATNLKFADGSDPVYSMGTFAAQRTYAQQIQQHAVNWNARNPQDPAKLSTLMNYVKRFGGLSDGLVLAQSANPILRMVAGLVTETTTGAAGRAPNAAIRTVMLHRRLIGNTLLDYNGALQVWKNANGGSAFDTVLHGARKREFDNLVYSEILDRRSPLYQPQADASVRRAADALEQMFERTRQAQIDAGTLGSANLPPNSRGYVPQALDGAKLQALTGPELAAVHQELSLQFQANLGWEQEFADTFAPYYTDRVRRRSQGSKEVDSLGAGGNALQVIRDTLDEMGYDPTMRDRMTAMQQARAGLKNTKRRLDLDLRREFLPGRRLMEVYVTDPLALARQQARQTAGTVALTEQGILGVRGVRELREAAALGLDGNKPTLQELEAFDRVTSEILGNPVAGQVASAGASNLQLIVGLQRLGGLAFTQSAELFNMVNHLGLRSLMSSIGSLPRMMGEVGRLKRGRAAGNSILDTIETMGGEIGTENFKMVAPLDPPEARLEDYMQQTSMLTRLLRAGGHAQAKISFFRGILSAQHRAVAEQITLKALRFINEGQTMTRHLADMGFTPEVVAAVRADLPRIAQFDASGRAIGLDLTRVSDPRVAEAFVQSVHRGTSQIIQGTFIGERSKWLHNDYMRLMLQLRTFGLTSMEKQFGRNVALYGGGFMGYGYAAGIMVGQMAMAFPIHLARVHAAAAGREDREKYLKDNLNPAAVLRATMNYSSSTGSFGDIAEILSAVAGGWMDKENAEIIGARSGQATSVGRLVPAAGTVDTAFKVVSGKSDWHTAIKQLPFSNVPYLLPFINTTKQE